MKLPFRPLILALALCNLGAMQVDTQMPLVKTLECMKRNAPKSTVTIDEYLRVNVRPASPAAK